MNDSVKNVWKPLCIVFAALLALSWVFFGFLYSKGGVDFSTLEMPEQGYMANNGGAIIGESTGNGARIMSVQIPAENYAEYGISPMAESAYQLTATITPDNATNKAVDWAVAFVEPLSEWATGKTVTDYVTVTPASDGALTANVECLQAFGKQIKITVTSRDNKDIKAECTVDFAKRIIGAKLLGKDLFGLSSDFEVDLFNAESHTFDDVFFGSADFSFTYSAYTVDDTFDVSYDSVGTQEMVDILKSGGLTSAVAANAGEFIVGGSLAFDNGEWYDYYSGVSLNDAVAIVSTHTDVPFAKFTANFTGTYSEYSFSVDFYNAASAYSISVTNVSLDPSNVII